jgi:hypothetical protein
MAATPVVWVTGFRAEAVAGAGLARFFAADFVAECLVPFFAAVCVVLDFATRFFVAGCPRPGSALRADF